MPAWQLALAPTILLFSRSRKRRRTFSKKQKRVWPHPILIYAPSRCPTCAPLQIQVSGSFQSLHDPMLGTFPFRGAPRRLVDHFSQRRSGETPARPTGVKDTGRLAKERERLLEKKRQGQYRISACEPNLGARSRTILCTLYHGRSSQFRPPSRAPPPSLPLSNLSPTPFKKSDM